MSEHELFIYLRKYKIYISTVVQIDAYVACTYVPNKLCTYNTHPYLSIHSGFWTIGSATHTFGDASYSLEPLWITAEVNKNCH